MSFLLDHAGTILIWCILAAAFVSAVIVKVKRKKHKGCSGCCGCCSGHPECSSSTSDKT